MPSGRLSRDDQLPFLVRDTIGPRRSTAMAVGRFWRSMPRLVRSLLLLATIVTFFFTVRVLGSTGSQDSTNEILEQGEIQARIDNRNEIVENRDQEQQAVASNEKNEIREQLNGPSLDSGLPHFKGPSNDRQRAVVSAFQYAWRAYKKDAWGHDQLKPISRSYSDWFDTGLTIVDGLDTAIIMGLKKEVAEATEWIRSSLSFEKDRYVNFFESSIRILGGLLSAYHLTGDQMFADRAKDVGIRLTGAWTHSPSSIPFSDVNLKTKAAKGPNWGADSSLSEATTVQLEYRDLSRITGDVTFEQRAFNTSTHIHEIGCAKHGGLCDMFVNAQTGKFKTGTTITFGARADSYYEYLLKQYLQTGKTIPWLLSDYSEAMDSMERLLLRESQPHKLRFVGELLSGDAYSPKMDHLVCFLSGTLVLGNLYAGQPEKHLQIAKDLGEACHAMYETATGLAPEIAYFNMDVNKEEDVIIKPLDSHCLLRPEAIEAWFYLYRATGDKKYQEWGWNAFQAIEKYARIESGGYSSVNNVKTTKVTYRDLMESFFLAETLKYLYLLLADGQTTLLPLDKWVFNTEGHPLPIRDH